MPRLAEFRYLKPQQRGAKTILYGAREKDGPWFRLTKRETAFLVANLDTILPAVKKRDT